MDRLSVLSEIDKIYSNSEVSYNTYMTARTLFIELNCDSITYNVWNILGEEMINISAISSEGKKVSINVTSFSYEFTIVRSGGLKDIDLYDLGEVTISMFGDYLSSDVIDYPSTTSSKELRQIKSFIESMEE